jgi:serine/threonine-protein kinase RsbW
MSSAESCKRMSEHRWTWTAETRLPSRQGAHLPYMEEILRELKVLGWNGRDLFGVQLALEESLTNAIRHGNRLDDSKQVVVQCKLSPERFWLKVRDEGGGFQPQTVPDCTADENLECPGGRGLALIMAYMTRVEYNKRGNCVTMEKIRSDDGANPPVCRPCEPDESPPK